MTQEEYIAILFADLGFSGAQKRNWLQCEFGHPYADELSGSQRSAAIDLLKQMKEDRKPEDDFDGHD